MAFNKKDPDRMSRFVWTEKDIVIIKGDEELPKSDTEPSKPASDANAPSTSKDPNDDQEQNHKP